MSDKRTVTEAEWRAEAERLYGPDTLAWRFRCPAGGRLDRPVRGGGGGVGAVTPGRSPGLIAPGPGVELLFRGGLVHRVSGPLAAFWEERDCGRCLQLTGIADRKAGLPVGELARRYGRSRHAIYRALARG